MSGPSQAYDSWHHSVDEGGATADLHLSQWHKDALSLAPDLEGLQVLEVACGRGDFAIHLAIRGATVSAVDFAPVAIDLARARAGAHQASIAFQVADAERLPFPDATFDLLFCCECLEHLLHPALVLKEMARVLKSGGRLVLTTENYSNAMVLAWLVAWWRKVPFNSGSEIQPIERFFLFWQVRRLLRDAGFTVKRMIGAHHVFLLLPRFHPHYFVRERFHSPLLSWLFRPWARHVTFLARKP